MQQKSLIRTSWPLVLVLGAGFAPGAGAALSVSDYSTDPIVDGSASSAKVFEIGAEETGGEAKVFVYPLLQDSSGPPSPLLEMFGTLVPGSYRVGLSVRFLEPPTELKLSWIGEPQSGSNSVQKVVPLDDFDTVRWFRVEGTVTVSSSVWHGRPTLVVRSDSGFTGRRMSIWIDDLELEQTSDLPDDPDTCDPHCFAWPLDFEGDEVGTLPARVYRLAVSGGDTVAEVADHLTWQPLPDWYEQERVQLHTRLRARECLCIPDGTGGCNPSLPGLTYPVGDPFFLGAASQVAAMGAGAWTRHVKWGSEGPWWPTEVPSTSPSFRPACVNDAATGEEDIAGDLIAAAHAEGTRLFAYYWMMADDAVRAAHANDLRPWEAADHLGNPIESASNRGDYLTQNSPYPAEVVAGRLAELVERGPDGIYFDEDHNPPAGDWSPWSAEDFAAAGHGGLPAGPDLGLAKYRRLLDLYDRTVQDGFRRYHRAVHTRPSSVPAWDDPPVLVVSAGGYPTLWELVPGSGFVEQQQAVKGEWHKPWKRLRHLWVEELEVNEADHGPHLPDRDLQIGLATALLRDTAAGRAPHIWVQHPSHLTCPSSGGYVPSCDPSVGANAAMSEWQLSAAAGALVTYGAVANLDVLENKLEEEDPRYGPALEFGALAGPVLAGTRAHRWVGIHFNEHARRAIYEDPLLTVPQKRRQAWDRVLAPAVYAFDTLQRHGIPAGFVTDGQLARGELYRDAANGDNPFDYLFLPSDELSAPAAAGRAAFEAAGGVVISSEAEGWTWYAEPDGQGGVTTAARERAAGELLERLSPTLGVDGDDGRVFEAPIQVRFATDGAGAVEPHVGAYVAEEAGGRRLVLALQNRFDWMLDTGLSQQQRREFVPSQVTGTRIYLRRGLVTGDHTFRYASLEGGVWNDLPPGSAFVNEDAVGGTLVILSLGTNLPFRSTLLIEAVPPP